MPRPVCVMCQREMRCNKNGRILELISGGMPYQLWSGDEYKCPTCGATVITRYGREPVAEGHERERYEKFVKYEKSVDNVVSIEV